MAQIDNQAMRQQIEQFLASNPDPSDEQFHEFARSQGYDPETLESVVYEMLGEEIEHQEGEAPDPDFRPQQNVDAASTHFEVGDGGEYGEGRPASDLNEDGEESNAFDLAVDAPETKDLIQTACTARLRVSASWEDETAGEDEEGIGEDESGTDEEMYASSRRRQDRFAGDADSGFEVAADAGAPGDDGLSEQQRVLQGDENPQEQDVNSVPMNDGAEIDHTSDNEVQDALINDGAVVDASVGEDNADQAFERNDGSLAEGLCTAATRRLKSTAAKQPTWTSHKYPLRAIVKFTDHKGREREDQIMEQVFYGPDDEPAYRMMDNDGVVLEKDIIGKSKGTTAAFQ